MVQVHVRSDQGIAVSSTLAEALGAQASQERLLFVHPHDDDANVGVGMTIALAIREGFDVHIGIATDGCQGYCRIEDKDTIVAIRHREALAANQLLGVSEDHIHFLGFADCSLEQATGRRVAEAGEPEIAGFTGLENSLTQLIRAVAPRRIFTPASADLHPDHQAVHKDLLISIYHASGDIWPELGPPCALPEVYEYPTYVVMAAPPDIMVKADEALFQRKLDAIRCYASQQQIELVMAAIREAGPVEFIRNIRFALYHPSVYLPLFGEPAPSGRLAHKVLHGRIGA